jgi:hypothetical protein
MRLIPETTCEGPVYGSGEYSAVALFVLFGHMLYNWKLTCVHAQVARGFGCGSPLKNSLRTLKSPKQINHD